MFFLCRFGWIRFFVIVQVLKFTNIKVPYCAVTEEGIETGAFHSNHLYLDHNCAQYCTGFLNDIFKGPWPIKRQIWRAGTITYLSYRPARPHRQAESIPRNRFLGSIKFTNTGFGCFSNENLSFLHSSKSYVFKIFTSQQNYLFSLYFFVDVHD